jgi:arabinofuranan 3-O-arabinosyltransferase
VHKFDVVLRLPLVLGLAWVVDDVTARLGARHDPVGPNRTGVLVNRVNLTVLVGTAVVAVFGAALPAVAGRITPSGTAPEIPAYWSQTARWLAREPGTALLVPGSSFGSYVWGVPRDEPLQALAEHPWAVRNAVPLTPPGNIRMLDAIERRLAQGEASSGLATYLRRAGVSHLVVRNDLARSSDVPDPVLVHQAIAGSPDLARVASFGPDIGGQAHLKGKVGRILVNGGWQDEYPAIEIFAVGGAGASAIGSETLPVVVGGAEDLLDLADLGVLGDEPTQLAVDVHSTRDATAPLVLTDGLRAVEQHFGRVHDGVSATRAPGDPRRMGNRSLDYLPEGAARWSTRARYEGVAGLTASSSMSDANAAGITQPGEQPFAAMDGDPVTAWSANYEPDERAWWQVDFDEDTDLSEVTITAGTRDREVVRLRSPSRVSSPIVLQPGASRQVGLDDADARWLRIEDASGRTGHKLALAEVQVPGVRVERSLVLPRLPQDWGSPDQIVLRAVDDARTGCVKVDAAVRCVPDREVAGEEPHGFSRLVTLNSAQTFRASLDVRVRAGDALLEELLRDQPVGISSTTTSNPDVRGSALAAVDGDPGTTWTAALSDLRPTIRMNWLGRKKISGLSVSVAADTAARMPELVELQWPGGSRTVTVPPNGNVSFPAFRTDRLTLLVSEARPATSLDFDSHASLVPVGISELRLRGLDYLPLTLPTEERRRACGSGPTLGINGVPVLTSVSGSPASLYRHGTAKARLCGAKSVRLDDGANHVVASASSQFSPTSLVLDGAVNETAPTTALTVEQLGPVERRIRTDSSSKFVSLKENANDGWQASEGVVSLRPVVIDGWQQGWQVRKPGGVVSVSFAPDRTYRLGLAIGLAVLGLLVGLSMATRRRWRDERAPLASGQPSTVGLVVLSVLSGGVVAGGLGAALTLVACVTARVLVRWLPIPSPWILGTVVLPAVGAYAVEPWGGADGWAGSLAWPQYLVVLACGFLLGALPAESVFPKFFSRMPGFSTRR